MEPVRKLSAILGILFAASLLVVLPSPAHAGARVNCHHQHWVTYIGNRDVHPAWSLHARLARIETDARECISRKTGFIVHRKSYYKMAIYPNSYSRTAGFEWGHSGDRRIVFHDTGDWFTDKRYIHGWWRQCAVLHTQFSCGPTGDFTFVLTYNAPWAQYHHHVRAWTQYRRAGEPFKNPGPYDSSVRFYDTPGGWFT